ncbi:Uncharacterised protein [Mycoplasmopsis citelli]|uniref:Uncharacterized protein n=1 Tax=Mycoplasmopsis citelli TaxID=171281 RepID=A0A449B122_9BACT|nr:hypothetical protein [Mycoplasmopsis citelli]VEU74298.1 Uncharacterised protein [Mycoplasmopsis citelli]
MIQQITKYFADNDVFNDTLNAIGTKTTSYLPVIFQWIGVGLGISIVLWAIISFFRYKWATEEKKPAVIKSIKHSLVAILAIFVIASLAGLIIGGSINVGKSIGDSIKIKPS